VKVAGYSIGAIWCATHGLGFVVCHLGCSTFVPAGEHGIAVRCYGTPVVIGVARYCVGVTGVCRSVRVHYWIPVVHAHRTSSASVTRKDLQFGT